LGILLSFDETKTLFLRKLPWHVFHKKIHKADRKSSGTGEMRLLKRDFFLSDKNGNRNNPSGMNFSFPHFAN
jgi:hypothetical protein